MVGGDGADRLYGQGGCDYLKGGLGNDLLFPGPPGTVCAGSLQGEGGRDRFVIASIGRSDVFGGPGKDTLDFRQSPSAMTVDQGSHPPTYDFAGAPSTSSVIYDVEVVFGSQFGDTINGSDLDDDLRGFGGDDYLSGWDGDARLIGGDGIDQMDGGAGSDISEGGTCSCATTDGGRERGEAAARVRDCRWCSVWGCCRRPRPSQA